MLSGKSKKILLILLALVLIGATAHSVYLIKKRNSSSQNEEVQQNDVSQDDSGDDEDGVETVLQETIDGTSDQGEASKDEDQTTEEDNIPVNSVNIDVDDKDIDLTNVFASITNYHCSSNCEAFASNFEYLEYCQQVCGILPENDDVSESDCKKKDDLEQDYCYKDLAIKELDASYCNKINDANVFNTCKNRILEEVLEK